MAKAALVVNVARLCAERLTDRMWAILKGHPLGRRPAACSPLCSVVCNGQANEARHLGPVLRCIWAAAQVCHLKEGCLIMVNVRCLPLCAQDSNAGGDVCRVQQAPRTRTNMTQAHARAIP